MKNWLELDIPSMKEILEDREISAVVGEMLGNVLCHLGISGEKNSGLIGRILLLAKGESLLDYELYAHTLLEEFKVTSLIPAKLVNRAELAFSQVLPFVNAGRILDFGCGDGRIGLLLSKKGNDVVLADIYKNSNIDATSLPFALFNPSKNVPFEDNSFDTTLALTVFHHCSNPLHAIRDVHRVTKKGGKAIVIESVYGVTKEMTGGKIGKNAENYLLLDAEKQRKVNIFFDHFYNRVIHYSTSEKSKVNVPFNFNTPAGWKKVFEKEGFAEEKAIHLGVDQPAVPEYHTLHVLRKL